MEYQVIMPTLSATEEEGVVATWFVRPGEKVSKDQLLAEVQVVKTAFEIHSPVNGTMKEIRIDSQGIARQGEVIAIVSADN